MEQQSPSIHTTVTTHRTALREKDVLKRVRFSKSQLWRLVRSGQFPKPIRLSERTTAWDSQAIDTWLAAKFSGDQS
jgi:predicted DNA-binding transcriptional regulator AlpA